MAEAGAGGRQLLDYQEAMKLFNFWKPESAVPKERHDAEVDALHETIRILSEQLQHEAAVDKKGREYAAGYSAGLDTGKDSRTIYLQPKEHQLCERLESLIRLMPRPKKKNNRKPKR